MDYPSTSGDLNNTHNIPKKSRVDTCFVPMCPCTSTKFPNKLFLTGPSDPKLRKKWFLAAKRNDYYSPKTIIRCCEDHFDLDNDVENWIKFKMCGGKLFLKKDVVPHIFECQNRMMPLKPRSVIMKRRKREILESIANSPDPSSECSLITETHGSQNIEVSKNKGNPIVIKEELNISPEVVYIKSEPVENEDGYESNKCEDRMSIQVELDVVKVEEDSNPQHNGDNSNIPTKPEESQSKDIEKEVPTKEAYILLEDCMKELECNNCYCRNCKTLLPSVDALEIHYTNAHSLLIPIKRYKFGSKTSQEMIKLYKQAIKKEITNNEHNYAKTTDV